MFVCLFICNKQWEQAVWTRPGQVPYDWGLRTSPWPPQVISPQKSMWRSLVLAAARPRGNQALGPIWNWEFQGAEAAVWLNTLDQTPGNYQTIMETDIYISPELVREIVLFSQTQSWRQHLNNSQHADHPWSSPSCYRGASPDWDYQWVYAWPHAGPAANQRPSHKWPVSPEDI